MHGIRKLAATVVPVDSHAEVVACRDVARLSRTNVKAGRRLVDHALHAGKRFAHHEAKLRVKRKRAVVMTRLNRCTPANCLSLAPSITACINCLPTLRFCAPGSIVIGPSPAMVVRSSKQLLPTTFPFCSATRQKGKRELRESGNAAHSSDPGRVCLVYGSELLTSEHLLRTQQLLPNCTSLPRIVDSLHIRPRNKD